MTLFSTFLFETNVSGIYFDRGVYLIICPLSPTPHARGSEQTDIVKTFGGDRGEADLLIG